MPADVLLSEAPPFEVPSLGVPALETTPSALSQSSTQRVTIEDVLDEWLAGKITRDETVARIRTLLKDPGE